MPKRMILCAGLLALLAAAYLLWGLSGNLAYVLQLRATKLAGLLVVGASVAVATVLFQTVSNNRILTPSIMGFDALYVLMQTAMVASLGITGYASLPPGLTFLAEVAVMMAAAMLLFGTLLGRGARDVARMILTGVILGILFRSVSGLLARVMDPNAFAVVQDASFASFSRIDAALLGWGAALAGLAMAAAWVLAPRLDVMALGRNPAVSLGLRYDRMVLAVLALVATLMAVSTALVGPVAFFGLIVAGLARGITRSDRHATLLPAAVLVAAIILTGGQFLFERVLRLESTLSVVVEFLGGLFFLYLLLKGRGR